MWVAGEGVDVLLIQLGRAFPERVKGEDVGGHHASLLHPITQKQQAYK
jgi:hypothetical protein